MESSDLGLFFRVLDLTSISAAARSLNISAAVASQRLQKLERELGVRLFQRTTRRLVVTPEGLALAEQGRSLVEDLETLSTDLKGSISDITGTLRLTTSATFGRQFIYPLLDEFLHQHQKLRCSVTLTDQMLDIVAGGYDVAIRIGQMADSSLVAKWLAPNRRILCASPEYLRRRGEPQVPTDLQGHECLVLGLPNGRDDQWQFLDEKDKKVSVRVRGRFDSNQGELLQQAAISGLGIAIHSTWQVQEDLASGRLVRVLSKFQIEDTGIYAVMPQRRLVPLRVRAFVQLLSLRLSGDVHVTETVKTSP